MEENKVRGVVAATRFDGEEWMPFFGRRFWESERVQALSEGACNLYQWLLWLQWERESLPQPAALQRVVPFRWGSRWAELWGEVAQFFDACPDGRLRNEPLAIEREIAEARRRMASEKGRTGGRAKAKREAEERLQAAGKLIPSAGPGSSTGTSTGSATATAGVVPQLYTGPDRTGPDREPPPTPPSGGKRANARRVSAMPPIPPELDQPAFRAAWDDWLAYRRERHLPTWKPRTVRANFADWVVWGPEQAVVAIRKAIKANWSGVFEPRGDGPQANGRAPAAPRAKADPHWKQLGYASEAEYVEAKKLADTPKPKLGELLAQQRKAGAA
jgi:hypothetical protein